MPTRHLGPEALASKLRSYLASACPKLHSSRLSTATLDLFGALEEQMAGRLSVRPAPSTADEVQQLHASMKQQLERYVQRKTREHKRHAAVAPKARSLTPFPSSRTRPALCAAARMLPTKGGCHQAAPAPALLLLTPHLGSALEPCRSAELFGRALVDCAWNGEPRPACGRSVP